MPPRSAPPPPHNAPASSTLLGMTSPDQPHRTDDPPLNRAPASSISETVGGFTRTVTTQPGFLDTVPDRYGKHGTELSFLLSGELGVTRLVVFTDWVPGEQPRPAGTPFLSTPGLSGAGISYHWRTPVRPDGEVDSDQCHWLGGAPCHSHTAYVRADLGVEALVQGGLSAVWALLLADYLHTAELAADIAQDDQEIAPGVHLTRGGPGLSGPGPITLSGVTCGICCHPAEYHGPGSCAGIDCDCTRERMRNEPGAFPRPYSRDLSTTDPTSTDGPL